MQILSTMKKNTLYCVMKGELDEHSSLYARETLDKLFDNANFKEVIIDLSEMTFMDSTGIGVFLGRYKNLKMHRVPIYVANPSNQIDKIFNMSGLYTIMPKINTRSDHERV